MSEPITLHSSFLRICAERQRQDQLHPRDDWPMVNTDQRRKIYRWQLGDLAAHNDWVESQGRGCWLDLLREELFKAAVETDPSAQAEGLLQLAAPAIRAACALTRQEEA